MSPNKSTPPAGPSTEALPVPPPEPLLGSANAPVIVDLGVKSRKKIKKLKKGQGPLFVDLLEAVEELKADGIVAPGAQIVIAVVKQKPEVPTLWN